MNEKIFSTYTMKFDGNTITEVIGKNGKTTQFSNTFYVSNQEYLDTFDNVLKFVKPKKDKAINNNIIINLDDFSIRYSQNDGKIDEEDLKIALKIVRNEISETSPEIAKHKALLLKYNSDVKTLKDLSIDGMDFTKEIEEIEVKIEEEKALIDTLME